MTGDRGDYEWNTDNLIGVQDMVIGAYTVNSDCTEVTITPKGQSTGDIYEFHFEGDLLVLEGTINAMLRELEFKK